MNRVKNSGGWFRSSTFHKSGQGLQSVSRYKYKREGLVIVAEPDHTYKQESRRHSDRSMFERDTKHMKEDLNHRCVETRKSGDDLRDPSDDLRRLDRNPNFHPISSVAILTARNNRQDQPASRSSRLASRVSLRIGPARTRLDRKRSPTNAPASTGVRSAEVLLDVGRFALDFKYDIGGKEEGYEPEGMSQGQEESGKGGSPVGYIGKRSYLSISFSLASFAASDIAVCFAGSIRSTSFIGPGLILYARGRINSIEGQKKIPITYYSLAATLKS